jgi:uncharacterized protein DUF6600/FecR-like protein
MLRHKGLLSLIFTLAVLLVPIARAQDETHVRIVRLSYVEGQVELEHAQTAAFESVTLNTPLVEGDQLRTGSDGRAEIQFEDGSTIRMAPETQIAFSGLSRLSSGAAITSVDLNQGEAEFNVSRHDDHLFQIQINQRTLFLKHSSRFRVTTTNSDPLEVAVWKGEVGIRDTETGEEISVKKNESFAQDALDASRYDLEKGIDTDALDQWSGERDNYLSSYANSGYAGSPYQYGVSDLNYYGQFVNVAGYGYCWRPYGVNLGWDPFMNGYWTYSPAFGYVWVSAYPWGWMPYRYGHWVFLNGYGWLWQPGNFQGWIPSPRLVNPPAGFHAPVPPAPPVRAGTTVPATGGSGLVSGSPGTFNIGGRTPDRSSPAEVNPGVRPGQVAIQGQTTPAGRKLVPVVPENQNPVRVGTPVMSIERPIPAANPPAAPQQPRVVAPAPSAPRRVVTPPPAAPAPTAPAPVVRPAPPVSPPAPRVFTPPPPSADRGDRTSKPK